MVEIDSEPGVVDYKSWGDKVAVFGHSAANFSQRRLWVLISSIFPLYSSKTDFGTEFCMLKNYLPTKKKF